MLLTEYLEGGELFQRISSKDYELTEAKYRDFFRLILEATKIEAEFYEEIHALEYKYHELYNPRRPRWTRTASPGWSTRPAGKKDSVFIFHLVMLLKRHLVITQKTYLKCEI